MATSSEIRYIQQELKQKDYPYHKQLLKVAPTFCSFVNLCRPPESSHRESESQAGEEVTLLFEPEDSSQEEDVEAMEDCE
jgi:hypothetical protein